MKHFFSTGVMMFQTACLLLTGCSNLSEVNEDPDAGLNGGFEISENGLPVNWHMYTPRTVGIGDFSIVLDDQVYKEGTQSLRFDVRACVADGGHLSPGFTSEFSEAGRYEGPGKYKVSFWVLNQGSRYRISAGGVETKKGNMQILIDSSVSDNEWKLLEYVVDIAGDQWLRLELNILQPGTFRIDGVEITKE